jgi:hypothetical protein
MPARPSRRLLATIVVASAILTSPPDVMGRRQAAAGTLVLEAATVEPKSAGPDTLCHLSARIRNDGKATASGFGFRVELDDREVGVYRDHLFMDPVEPGEARVLPLFSFWTEETGRPLPENGRIVVEVTLLEARWMKEEKDADGTRVWSDLGAVAGLPQTATFTVEIKK